MTSKPSNPKNAYGVAKVPSSTVPAGVSGLLGLALLEGALKYGRHNYRVAGASAAVYYDACKRHLDAYWEGQDIDPDSGLPHLAKAMACCAIILDAEMCGMLTDDRPPPLPADWQVQLNRLAASLIERYPDCKEPFTRESVSHAQTHEQ